LVSKYAEWGLNVGADCLFFTVWTLIVLHWAGKKKKKKKKKKIHCLFFRNELEKYCWRVEDVHFCGWMGFFGSERKKKDFVLRTKHIGYKSHLVYISSWCDCVCLHSRVR
jgi:hypothetical protein